MEFGKYGHCAIMAFELVKNEEYRQEKRGKLQLKRYLKDVQAVLLKFVLKMLFEFNGAK